MRKRQKSFVVVEGDNVEQEPNSDSLFACIRPNSDNKQTASKVQFKDQEEEDEGKTYASVNVFDLLPWTDEELKREVDLTNNKSKI